LAHPKNQRSKKNWGPRSDFFPARHPEKKARCCGKGGEKISPKIGPASGIFHAGVRLENIPPSGQIQDNPRVRPPRLDSHSDFEEMENQRDFLPNQLNRIQQIFSGKRHRSCLRRGLAAGQGDWKTSERRLSAEGAAEV